MPQVHPHWLFFFRVADIEAALAKVRALGGNGAEPTQAASGEWMAACHDAQGAAFGLLGWHAR